MNSPKIISTHICKYEGVKFELHKKKNNKMQGSVYIFDFTHLL